MDFALSEDYLAVQEVARGFAEKKLKPRAEEFDAEATLDRSLLKELGELGLMGITLPEEYGGGAMDTLSYMITVEELSRGCSSHAGVVVLHNSLYGFPLVKFGSDEQKQTYLPGISSGDKVGAFALSEPGAGSDAASITTTYEKTDDGYVLNGTKIFITMGSMADSVIVFAINEKGAGAKGISAFLVDNCADGYSVGADEKKMGFRASPTSELVFNDCFIPGNRLLGEEGQGFAIAMSTLDVGRTSCAAMALGIAEEAFDIATKYAKEREQFGRPIAAFQAIQFHLADMSVGIENTRMLVYRAASLKDHGEQITLPAAQAKLYGSEMATRVTHSAVQILGGYGYCRDYQVERLYRDARVTELFEGTSEVQRLVIARQVLS
ncbi:MAG: acyl-CoA dehydrogenase family protein [Candidatus Zixiibacteriota bacterium]